MIIVAMTLALLATAPGSIDVTVHGAGVPPKCGAFDAYYYGCALSRSKAAKAQQDLRQKVGAMIADGKCDDAYRTALQAGDFEIAQQVHGLCQPPATAGH